MKHVTLMSYNIELETEQHNSQSTCHTILCCTISETNLVLVSSEVLRDELQVVLQQAKAHDKVQRDVGTLCSCESIKAQPVQPQPCSCSVHTSGSHKAADVGEEPAIIAGSYAVAYEGAVVAEHPVCTSSSQDAQA
jgi:hypothetical protein